MLYHDQNIVAIAILEEKQTHIKDKAFEVTSPMSLQNFFQILIITEFPILLEAKKK